MKKLILILLTLMLVSTAFGLYRDRGFRGAFYNLTIYNDLTVGDDINMTGTGKIYLSSTTYIVESSTGVFDLYCNNVHMITFVEGAVDYIEPKKDFRISNLQLTKDGGAMTFSDMAVSSTPAAGAEESYAWKIDANAIATVYAEANSSGGIQNPAFIIGGAAIYGNSVTLADDAEVALKTGVAGFGQVFANDEWMHFWFTSAGVATKIAGTANTAVIQFQMGLHLVILLTI